MIERSRDLDLLLRALADPTRRAVVERLSRGDASVSELAEPFEMTLPSFVRHLRILEEAGVVRTHKVGRVRRCELAPERLVVVGDWLEEQRRIWEARLDQLDAYLRRLHAQRTNPDPGDEP